MSIGALRLKGALVAGDQRLELLDWKSDALPHLKAAGCFTEIIQHRTRLFVPPSRAVEILGELAGLTAAASSDRREGRGPSAGWA